MIGSGNGWRRGALGLAIAAAATLGLAGPALAKHHKHRSQCFVEKHVPAVTRTVHKRVLVSPARTLQVQVPAETHRVRRRVLVESERTRMVTHPAVTRPVPPLSKRSTSKA